LSVEVLGVTVLRLNEHLGPVVNQRDQLVVLSSREDPLAQAAIKQLS
jgi:hypothetical protein